MSPLRNGYAMFEADALAPLARHLAGRSDDELDALRCRLRIGVQWGVKVTAAGASAGQTVTQAFCSALPIGYHHDLRLNTARWEPLARLVLDALYEATLWAAVLNAQSGGTRTVLLTFVGGGVFANEMAWIRAAIERAIRVTGEHALGVWAAEGKSLMSRDLPER